MTLLFKTLASQRQAYRGFLIFFLFMALIVASASVFMTQLTGDMGQAALDMDTTALLALFGILTGVMVLRAVASAASALFLGRFGGVAGYRFRDNFAKYFLQKPFSAFEGAKSGESLSVFSNDLPAAVELVANGGIRMLSDIITLLVTVVYMLYINWWLSLIFFAAFPILIILQVMVSIPIQKKSARRLAAREQITAISNDSFQNTSTIVSYSLEDVMVERCRTAFEEWLAALRSMAQSYLVLIMAGVMASITPLLIIIAVSAGQVINGNMYMAQWIAFLALAAEAGQWLTMLSQRQNQVQTAAAGAKRMAEHMTSELEDIKTGNSLAPTGDIAIAAENLSFAYPGQSQSLTADVLPQPERDVSPKPGDDIRLALQGVSFEIKQGDRVAFVGGSGSGKSTVLKLLLGLYKPGGGKISVMGQDMAGISLEALRGTFAYVPQDSFLFPETIGENITGESTILDMPRLEKACSDAGILEFIQSQPGGFDAVLSESAENVSGGQKQRIALARAFYRDAPIILFDEATSALDPATEAAVLQSFNSLAKNKTVVMVAHRPMAISFCDTIIVMESGKIAAVGTHKELVSTSQIYKNLYEAPNHREVPA